MTSPKRKQLKKEDEYVKDKGLIAEEYSDKFDNDIFCPPGNAQIYKEIKNKNIKESTEDLESSKEV